MKLTNSFTLLASIASIEAAVIDAAISSRAPAAYYDYGELRLAITTSYSWQWDDSGSGARRDITLLIPNQDGDFRAFGSIGTPNYSNIVGKRATLFAALNPNVPPANPSMPALKSPIGWTQLWNDGGSGGTHDGSIWRPTCPGGYVSLGDVAQYQYKQPTASIWCLRQDLAVQGAYGQTTSWDDGGSGAKQDAYVWDVLPSSGVTGSEKIGLYTGTIRLTNNGNPPNEPAWTLSIDIPKAYKEFRVSVPTVSSTSLPSKGDLYSEVPQTEVVLPLTALYDPSDRKIIDYLSSPFVKISRSTAWYVEGIWYNNNSGAVKRTDTVEYGFSTEKTTAMEHSVGISVTASGGIKMVEYSVSLNYQFTYSSSTTTTEFVTKTKTEEFSVEAYQATVMFCKRIRIQVALLNGRVLSIGDALASGEFYLASDGIKH